MSRKLQSIKWKLLKKIVGGEQYAVGGYLVGILKGPLLGDEKRYSICREGVLFPILEQFDNHIEVEKRIRELMKEKIALAKNLLK